VNIEAQPEKRKIIITPMSATNIYLFRFIEILPYFSDHYNVLFFFYNITTFYPFSRTLRRKSSPRRFNRCVLGAARNLRGSVNEIGEMPRSGSAHDVLMQTLCKFLKQAEHSMGQPFKYGLRKGRKGKAFDGDEGCVVYYLGKEIQKTQSFATKLTE
jgi:hypothetical protein